MISRIAVSLITVAAGATVPANELFDKAAQTLNEMKGSTYEVALFDDAVIVNPNGTQVRERSSAYSKATTKLDVLIANGDIRTVLNFQRCNQEIVIRVFACSIEAGSAIYNCDYTLLSAKIKKGLGGCEL